MEGQENIEKEDSNNSSVKTLVMPLVLSDDDGIRPAGEPDECLYCKQKVGFPHLFECVILNKKVKLKYSFEVEVEMPWSWDKEQVEFNRNEGSWCASNALEELEETAKLNNGCLCDAFEAEVVSMSNKSPYRRNKEGDVVA